MSNGVNAAPGNAMYRVLRELGTRTLRCYAAIREPQEVVVLQRFTRAEPKSRDAMALSAEAMTQLVRDANSLAKNWHPNIARVKHVDVDGSDVLIATDLLDGMTLGDLFAASTAAPLLPPAVIARILVDVLAGLSALHALQDGTKALGVIHGELCPANIVVARDGVARVVNCVRARPVRVRAGSEGLLYAAPEALDKGGAKDARADVYSVGLILWEALMGRRPYDATDPAQLLALQREEEVTTPTLEAKSPFADLGVVAMRAMAFEPSLRYRTAAEMATALRKLAGPHIATGSSVAAKVAELAGDRIRARRAELDPAAAARRLRGSASSAQFPAAAPVARGSSPRLEAAAPASSPRIEAAPEGSRRIAPVAPASSPRLEAAPESSRRIEAAPQSSRRIEAAPESSRRTAVPDAPASSPRIAPAAAPASSPRLAPAAPASSPRLEAAKPALPGAAAPAPAAPAHVSPWLEAAAAVRAAPARSAALEAPAAAPEIKAQPVQARPQLRPIAQPSTERGPLTKTIATPPPAIASSLPSLVPDLEPDDAPTRVGMDRAPAVPSSIPSLSAELLPDEDDAPTHVGARVAPPAPPPMRRQAPSTPNALPPPRPPATLLSAPAMPWPTPEPEIEPAPMPRAAPIATPSPVVVPAPLPWAAPPPPADFELSAGAAPPATAATPAYGAPERAASPAPIPAPMHIDEPHFTPTFEPPLAESAAPRKPRGRVAVIAVLGGAVAILLVLGLRAVIGGSPAPTSPATKATVTATQAPAASPEVSANANANAEPSPSASASAEPVASASATPAATAEANANAAASPEANAAAGANANANANASPSPSPSPNAGAQTGAGATITNTPQAAPAAPPAVPAPGAAPATKTKTKTYDPLGI